jgi:hypothetical protein
MDIGGVLGAPYLTRFVGNLAWPRPEVTPRLGRVAGLVVDKWH